MKEGRGFGPFGVLGMNIAARLSSHVYQLDAGSYRSGSIARIEVFSDLEAVEPVWRSLEHEAVTTPYQRFDFVAPWQRHIGEREGVKPFVVAGFDSRDVPSFLWPFGEWKKGPLRVVQFLGGKHANFNFALWRRDLAAMIGPIDLFTLLRQPMHWENVANPFALLPHQQSADECMRLTLPGSGAQLLEEQLSSAMRGRLRTKERKLQKLAGYRHFRAAAEDVNRLLDAFFPLKSAHMAAQGIADVFAQPGVEQFVRELCHRGVGTNPALIEIHALEGGGEVLAIFAAITDGRRFSLMFNTYTRSDFSRQSPGLILLVHVVSQCADRHLQTFDLGVGEAGYKSLFCKEPEPLFDSFLPLTSAGRLAAVLSRSGYGLKGLIKRTPVLWDTLQAMRRRVRGRPAGPSHLS
jgi:CelD/BcsL family acetyltransferase involved in cellulose biosynthesis